MTRRRLVFAAILLYVTLDLSLPMMPGAFEFELASTVDSIYGTRARLVSDAAPSALPVSRTSLALPVRDDVDHRRLQQTRPATAPRDDLRGVPRPPGEFAPTAEDPH